MLRNDKTIIKLINYYYLSPCYLWLYQGLGGLLTGDAAHGGLSASAGTPFGMRWT